MPRCDICYVDLADQRTISRHKKLVHNVYQPAQNLHCSECTFTADSLISMENHLNSDHDRKLEKVCIYCQTVFPRTRDFAEHMRNHHGLPAWDVPVDEICSIEPTETALNNNVKVYTFLPSNDVIDILDIFVQLKNKIDRIIECNVQHSAYKVQFCTELELTKHSVDSSLPETVIIYANSSMSLVDYDGLQTKTFYSMLDEVLSVFFNFSTQGSGWQLSKIQKIGVKLVRFSPIFGSSYLALPTELQRCQFLLNIRNFHDQNCFSYCYTAAFHAKYGPALVEPNTSWRTRTNPSTYSRENPNAKQPDGGFEGPMNMKDIPRFEQQNNVQINVFR